MLITGEQIDQARATSIIDVLRAVPGITADERGGPDGVKIRLRGVDNQRFMGEKPGVAIVIDGVPVFERTGRVNIDLDNIESIRVVKGGASYLYGEDALSGAVIITTKRGARHDGFTVEHDRGSFGYQRSYVKAGGAGERFGGHVQYSHRELDDYYALANSHAKTLAGNLQWFIDDDSDLTLGFEKSDRFRDREGSVVGATRAKIDPRGKLEGRGRTRNFDIDLQRLNLTYSNNFSDTGNLLAVVYQFDDNTDFWVAPILFSAEGVRVHDDETDRYQRINDYTQQQRGVKLEVRESFGRWGVMGGLEMRRNTFDEVSVVKEDYKNSPAPAAPVFRAGDVMSDSFRKERTRAAYIEASFGASDATTLTTNYRLDRIDLEDEDRMTASQGNKSLRVHSWRVGLDHRLSGRTALYGGISTGFRTPTLTELAGNPDLEPEHTLTYEFGMRSSVDLLGWRTHLNGSLFHIERKDFILSNVGQYVSTRVGGDIFHDNVGHTVSRGLELALQTEVQHQLGFDVAYTYLHNRFSRYDDYHLALGNAQGGTKVNSLADLTNPLTQVYFQHYNNKGKTVPRSPAHTLNFRTHWHPADGWRLTAELDHRSSSYADEINQEKNPARTLLNLMLSYDRNVRVFGNDRSRLRAFVKVDNVTDKRHWLIARGHHDANRDGVYNAEDLSIVPSPGRTWSAGLSLKF
ncbi:MAG TPA: TonB-dependent receptor [Azoarcus taiwanensis]|nr:TonB-dependent receptor [Azoarcus taiwanensis]